MKKFLFLLVLSVMLFALVACGPEEVVVTEVPTATMVVEVPTEAPTATLAPTQEPAAVTINGEAVGVSEVEAGVARYAAAQAEVGDFLATDDVRMTVINELVTQVLLSQRAKQNGFVLSEEELDARVLAAIESAGGQDAFNAWLAGNYYSAESFRSALRREIEAAWMRDQIIAGVPTVQEQVLAREIFFLNEADAVRVYNQLVDGSTFDSRVDNYDPQGLGYLGWFPRGVMFDQGLEDAIFALQPGQFSSVITTADGFHVAEVIERDAEREVSHDLLLILQENALQDWLAETKVSSTIQIAQ